MTLKENISVLGLIRESFIGEGGEESRCMSSEKCSKSTCRCYEKSPSDVRMSSYLYFGKWRRNLCA